MQTMQFQTENNKNVEYEDDSKENISIKKKPKPFLFPPPPPPQNLHEKTLEFPPTSTKTEQNLKNHQKTKTEPEDEAPIIVKLVRKQRKSDPKGNLSTISADLFRPSFLNIKNFEITNSLQEIKNIEENPFEEFEDEDRKIVGFNVRIDKIDSKFVLKNMKFTGICESPLKIENLGFDITYEKKQEITMIHVN